jgi:hypothetical protein
VNETNNPQDRSLQFIALGYCAMMLVALIIGLYGFFSLYWLTASEIAHAGRVI